MARMCFFNTICADTNDDTDDGEERVFAYRPKGLWVSITVTASDVPTTDPSVLNCFCFLVAL